MPKKKFEAQVGIIQVKKMEMLKTMQTENSPAGSGSRRAGDSW